MSRGERGGEPVEDLAVSSSGLRGVQVAASEIPAMIDEVPILALAAATARGASRFRGLAELRHKESDRLAAIADLLCLFGAKAAVGRDDLIVEGGAKLRPATADSLGDHRLAMTAFVAGFLAGGESRIVDALRRHYFFQPSGVDGGLFHHQQRICGRPPKALLLPTVGG